jgi:hypothetical protein
MIGIFLIVFSLCLQATLGNVQQYVVKKFKADYQENVYYSVKFKFLFTHFQAFVEYSIFFLDDK